MVVRRMVIIAIALGLAFLNLLLLATFCLLRQRRKDRKHFDDELGSLEDRLSPVKPMRSNLQIQRHLSRKEKDTLSWPSTTPIVQKPTYATSLNFLRISSLNPPLSSLSKPNDRLTVPANVGVSRRPTVTHRSEKSVSVYSTESAPLHFHDQLSNPLFLNRVIVPNITRANLPRGMNLPSSVTREIGLFISPLPKSGTATLPLNSTNVRLRDDIRARASAGFPSDSSVIESSHSYATPIRHSVPVTSTVQGIPNQVEPQLLLYSVVNPQPLSKIASATSFPPPLW